MRRLIILPLLFIMQWSWSQEYTADSASFVLANKVIEAMGGKQAFEETAYIGWQFFASRQLIWDKVHDRIRIDYLKKNISIIADLHGDNIKLFMNGNEIYDADSLKKYAAKAQLIWMNDSYWLIMPFKLLDPGVNLKYLGMQNSIDGNEAHVIELTFNKVGATPENKYRIFIDPATHYVVQWNYYETYDDPQPEFINSWGQYEKYGKIFLSGDRGTEGTLSKIHVWDELPEYIFSDMKIPPLSEL